MAFDGFVTGAMASELADKLTYGKVDKVYQPEKNELVLFIHTKEGKHRLYISADTNHAGIYITDEDFTNPTEPPAFCMLMRKHLIGGRISEIRQYNMERIIEIIFETRDELGFDKNKKLVVEIMGKHSNLSLVDMSSGKIIDSIKRVSVDVSRARQTLPGMLYEYPPSQNKTLPEDVDQQIFDNATDSRDILSAIEGISPILSQDLFECKDPLSKLQSWSDALKTGGSDIRVYLKEDGTPQDFHVVTIEQYRGLSSISFDTVSATAEYYYSHREVSNRIRQKSADLSKHLNQLLKKLYLKKQKLSEDLMEAENSEKYRLYGELLTAGMHDIKPGAEKATVLNYYTGEMITIPLDKRFHPSKNAQNYFKKYSKAKTAVVEKKNQLARTDGDISYLESVLNFVNSADSIATIDEIREELIEGGFLRRRSRQHKQNRKKDVLQPYTYRTSDGFIVMAGRNNKENDALTMKKASKNDMWFHTKDIPGSHTILFTEGKPASDNSIFEAAAIAAYHSKGRESENVPVDYTLVRHVKKPNGARPGMVIFTDNRTVYVTPKLPDDAD